jgi:hypothetical protein
MSQFNLLSTCSWINSGLHEGACRELMYSSYSYLTSATRWRWVVSVTPRPRFTPGKGPPVPIGWEAGWASEPVWTQRLEEKSLCPCRGSNLDRPIVQPVVRHYTAWATAAHSSCVMQTNWNLVVLYCRGLLLYGHILQRNHGKQVSG